jgi:hypothetical protein
MKYFDGHHFSVKFVAGAPPLPVRRLATIKVPLPPRLRPSLHSTVLYHILLPLSALPLDRPGRPEQAHCFDSSLLRAEFPSTMVRLRYGRRRAAWPT